MPFFFVCGKRPDVWDNTFVCFPQNDRMFSWKREHVSIRTNVRFGGTVPDV